MGSSDVSEGKTLGKEQLILLPVEQQAFQLTAEPDGTGITSFQTGRHAIVVSGYAGIEGTGPAFLAPSLADDDVLYNWDVEFLVGPFWLDIVQVSASVSFGGIASLISDEVDRSYWVVNECT